MNGSIAWHELDRRSESGCKVIAVGALGGGGSWCVEVGTFTFTITTEKGVLFHFLY